MRGAFGIENGDYDPESEFERVCGLRMQSFEPGWGFRRELRGSNGIENGDFEPGNDVRAPKQNSSWASKQWLEGV